MLVDVVGNYSQPDRRGKAMSYAEISQCGKYRYLLARGAAPYCVFLMLNPSTADANQDDPTIRRCLGFARQWGYNGLVVVNLYALRSTDPARLWAHPDPVGPDNDYWLIRALCKASEIVCAWGAGARADRINQVAELIKAFDVPARCLGTTKAGAPRHPLYVRGDQPLIDWRLNV